MPSVDITTFRDLGDSPWWRYQFQDIHQFDVGFEPNPRLMIYEPNISPVLGNRGIEIVKDGSVVGMLPSDARCVISTVQEPICTEGEYPYHENVDVNMRLEASCAAIGRDSTSLCWASGDYFAPSLNRSGIATFFVPGWNHLFWEHRSVAEIQDVSARSCQHTFLSFNRIHKPHRMYFILRLRQENLLRSNLVSCASSIDGETFVQHLRWIENDLDRHGRRYDPNGLVDIWELRREAAKLQPELPLVLDVSNFQENGCYGTDTFWSSLPFYQRSFMSVVTESNAVGPGCYISEAVFRPFVFMQPLMVIGQPRTMQILREWGFDLFDDVINHSYDLEDDQFTRTEMVISEILRLSSMGKSALDDITFALRQRLIYNRDRYFSREFKAITKSYLDKVYGWMDEN